MTGKTALRAVWQAEITLTDVRVPAENKLAELPLVQGRLRRCSTAPATPSPGARWAWRRRPTSWRWRTRCSREQFGQPIAGFQLVQDKLARMLAEITSMQLMCWRLSKLADAGRMTAAMASLAKMNHAAKARAIVADARDILGGDGILLDNHVARHHADMEAIFTFEGTDSVQALIVGREITGLSAISGRLHRQALKLGRRYRSATNPGTCTPGGSSSRPGRCRGRSVVRSWNSFSIPVAACGRPVFSSGTKDRRDVTPGEVEGERLPAAGAQRAPLRRVVERRRAPVRGSGRFWTSVVVLPVCSLPMVNSCTSIAAWFSNRTTEPEPVPCGTTTNRISSTA